MPELLCSPTGPALPVTLSRNSELGQEGGERVQLLHAMNLFRNHFGETTTKLLPVCVVIQINANGRTYFSPQ